MVKLVPGRWRSADGAVRGRQELRSYRRLPVLGMAALLASCAASPPISSALPLPPPAPKLTLKDLNTAARTAYREGFIAGEVFEHRLELRRHSLASLPSGHFEALATVSAPDIVVASKSAPFKPDLVPVPPSSRFSVIGTAQLVK